MESVHCDRNVWFFYYPSFPDEIPDVHFNSKVHRNKCLREIDVRIWKDTTIHLRPFSLVQSHQSVDFIQPVGSHRWRDLPTLISLMNCSIPSSSRQSNCCLCLGQLKIKCVLRKNPSTSQSKFDQMTHFRMISMTSQRWHLPVSFCFLTYIGLFHKSSFF